jgi:uncharacterized protein with PIN domain
VTKSKPRPRSQRRVAARAAEKLRRHHERLFGLEPGGSSDRPLVVSSASLVDLRAEALRCPACTGPLRVEEHVAVTVAEQRLRRADLRCRQCGSPRAVWFRIAGAPEPN